MRSFRNIALLSSIAVVGAACASSGAGPATIVQPVPTEAAAFSWNPVQQPNPRPFAMGILHPSYTLEGADGTIEGPIARSFLSSLSTDLEAALIAKGYTVSGTYQELDVMTYRQRQNAGLVLLPEIRMTVVKNEGQMRDVHWDSPATNGEPSGDGPLEVSRRAENVGAALLAIATGVDLESSIRKVEVSGTYSVSGRIDLRLIEPVTGELMWVQSVDLPGDLAEYTTYAWFRADDNGRPRSGEVHILSGYDGRQPALAGLLGRAYADLYETFDAYFDSAQLAEVYADAQQVRQLRRY